MFFLNKTGFFKINDAGRRNRIQALKRVVFVVLLLAAIALVWQLFGLPERTRQSLDDLQALLPDLVQNRNAFHPRDFLAVIAIFCFLTLLSFPVTVLILITASVFGPALGFGYAMTGVLCGSAAGFVAGHFAGKKVLHRLLGERFDKLKAVMHKAGVAGIVMLRMTPVAPFGAVNLTAGISSVSFPVFMAGTVIGTTPGTFAVAVLGDSLIGLIQDASKQDIVYFTAGALLWAAVVWGMHKFLKYWQDRKNEVSS